MKYKFHIVGTAIFIVGALAGFGLSTWWSKGQWDQWFVDFNMQPVMAEQTYVLKQLRQDRSTKLQESLEENTWRNIAMLVKNKEEKRPLPANAGDDLKYHCAYSESHAAFVSLGVASQRKAWCSEILAAYAARQ